MAMTVKEAFNILFNTNNKDRVRFDEVGSPKSNEIHVWNAPYEKWNLDVGKNTESIMGIANSVTPVPGGVGPMTIAMLLVNTITAANLSIHG